ncbi:hypothetical protein KQH58_16025, partial [Mycetohabitans sp. B6]
TTNVQLANRTERHRLAVRIEQINLGVRNRPPNRDIDVGADDRIAFAANPAFDASTFEVWAPLLNGAAAVVMD